MIKDLNDIKTLAYVSNKYEISVFTLKSRIESRKLVEGVDYKKLDGGARMPVILSPSGVKKII